jgi:pimeloyl-ACP methyl ester carboxylesterase
MTQVQHRTFVQTTHGDTHYVLEGAIHDKTAPLIVMVHGLGAGVFFFHFLAAFLVLTGGYRVLRIDRYGSGHSSVASAPHDGDLFVDQIKELLDKLNLNDSKLTFIGHSMGGAIACLFAAKYPEKIESLILLSPAGMRWYIFGIFILRWFPTVCRWILRKLTPVFLSRFVPLTFYDPDYASKGVKHFENSIKEAGFEHFADTMFQRYNFITFAN